MKFLCLSGSLSQWSADTREALATDAAACGGSLQTRGDWFNESGGANRIGREIPIREDGHVELLYRWDPHSACHLHRHTAAVSSLVLEGQLTVIDIETGKEAGRVVKPAGTWVHKAPGDVHVEVGGPEGALVLFNLYAPNGSLVEGLEKDGRVLDHQTIAPILKNKARHAAV